MGIKSTFSDLRYYGLPVTFERIKAMITGDDRCYTLKKQRKSASFSIEKIEKIVSDKFYIAKHERINWRVPETFDEKITWMMLYDATPMKTRLVDKYLVRDYIKDKVGEEYLVPILGVYNSFNEIDFAILPNQFVLKLNNGSGMNIVVKNKDNFDIASAKGKFEYWMKTNFAFQAFELQYRDVPQKIIVEKYMEQIDGNLYDYKIHCFGGKATICQVIGDRDLSSHKAYQAFFDSNWNRINESEGTYPEYEQSPPMPENWNEMKSIAERLAQGFSYVRVDLYSLQNKIYFGEFTFTPAMGCHPNFSPKSTDLRWGRMINLPQKYELEVPKK